MSIGGRRPKKGSLGTSFIIEKIPGLKRITCSNCINYNHDKSCNIKYVLMSEIGYDYWKQCDQFDLSTQYDTEDNRELANRTRLRIENLYKIDKKQSNKKGKAKNEVQVTTIKEKRITKTGGKKVISRLTVQQKKNKGESYQKIADYFGVDRELIRKIDLGFYGTGYKE